MNRRLIIDNRTEMTLAGALIRATQVAAEGSLDHDALIQFIDGINCSVRRNKKSVTLILWRSNHEVD